MSNYRTRERKRQNYCLDQQAESEGLAIERKWRIGVVHTPRLRKTYHIDGYTFHTGFSRRRGGISLGLHPEPLHVKPVRNSRQVNLASEAIHKRVEGGKVQYRLLSARRAQRLMYYKAKLIRGTNYDN